MKKIQVLIKPQCDAEIRNQFVTKFGAQCEFTFQGKETEDAIVAAEVMIGEPGESELQKAENLRWLQLTWAGVDKYTKMKENSQEYELIRSKRKSLALQVKGDGTVVVRAPLRLSEDKIGRFVREHLGWIEKQKDRIQELSGKRHVITEQERADGIQKALKIFPERTAFFAERMGIDYGRITVREQKTRWGSCSQKGNLNFNWKLVLMPQELLDYVVVHELAHRKEMNHSARFWAIVEQELPDYQKRRNELKKLGQFL